MAVDSYKFLPRSFRAGYEQVAYLADTPVWASLPKPAAEATIALLTSAGIYLRDSQGPFDVEREKQEPLWGDPTYRVIPRPVQQSQVDATHLHINTRDILADFNVALPIRAFETLASEGVIGAVADEHYSFMGFQERGACAWQEQYGPEIAARLREAQVDALVLAPA
jgi:D-proline reductase (dithiol) PrdB